MSTKKNKKLLGPVRTESDRRLEIVADGVRPSRVAPSFRAVPLSAGGTTLNGARISGGVGYSRVGVTTLAVPMHGGAYARTVRQHELLHANHTPVVLPRGWKKFPDAARQAIEDMRVHLIYWNPSTTPSRLNRDCLAVGWKQLHHLRLNRARFGDDYNTALIVAARSAAIVQRLSVGTKRYQRLIDYLESTFGVTIAQAVMELVKLVQKNNSRSTIAALRLFTSLLALDPDDDSFRETKREKNPVKPDEAKPNPKLDSLVPYSIVELPRSVPCSSSAPRVVPSRYGARIRISRIVPAIITGDTSRLFLRRKRDKDTTTILFDASGSMGVSESRLNDLARRAPAATIAFYSGSGDGRAAIVMYARDGRRAESLPTKHLYRGNEIDYWAIRWLLAQPGPRIFVSDGGFCQSPGALAGQDFAAAALVQRAVAKGDIAYWAKSYSEFCRVFLDS